MCIIPFIVLCKIIGFAHSKIIFINIGVGACNVILAFELLTHIVNTFCIWRPDIIFITTKWALWGMKRFLGHYICSRFIFGTYIFVKYMIELSVLPGVP